MLSYCLANLPYVVVTSSGCYFAIHFLRLVFFVGFRSGNFINPGSRYKDIGIIDLTPTVGDNNLHDLSFVPTVTVFNHGNNTVALSRKAIDLCIDPRVIVLLQTFQPLFLLPCHVQYALSRPIAMPLVWQNDQPGLNTFIAVAI
jgi:hypothetical protein